MRVRALMFGAGVQTTALVIMIAQGEVKVDMVVFADTGAEKPETYWYMENYSIPLLKEAGVEVKMVRNDLPYYQPDLYGFLWRIREIPSIHQRRCTDHFKIRPIDRAIGKEIVKIFGFSLEEVYRAKRSRHKFVEFPLIDRQMTTTDCRRVISDFGWPVPLKSSCYFCQFQHPVEWLWLKRTYPDLFAKALELEARFHERKPEHKNTFGLLRGSPLWKIAKGKQLEFGMTTERSCFSGHCGH